MISGFGATTPAAERITVTDSVRQFERVAPASTHAPPRGRWP